MTESIKQGIAVAVIIISIKGSILEKRANIILAMCLEYDGLDSPSSMTHYTFPSDYARQCDTDVPIKLEHLLP